jgi:hypothetical protein
VKRRRRRPLPPRLCSGCGRTYWRGSRFRLWTRQNPGHRDGWEKEERVYCVYCVPATTATRVLTVTRIRIVEGPTKKRQGRR